jgi:hypothetical protein
MKMGYNLVIRERAYFQTFIAVTPGIEMGVSDLCRLPVLSSLEK